MTNGELFTIIDALKDISKNIDVYKKSYQHSKANNEFSHIDHQLDYNKILGKWFVLDDI
jgi:hypothetical protein